jgi:hypothetical protein
MKQDKVLQLGQEILLHPDSLMYGSLHLGHSRIKALVIASAKVESIQQRNDQLKKEIPT